MNKLDRLVEQWLQAEVAFGVLEVPIPKAKVLALREKARAAAGQVAAAAKSAPSVRAAATLPPRAPARATPVPPARPAASAAIRPAPVPEPVALKLATPIKDLPPAPPGKLADEPQLSPAQKQSRMAELEKTAVAELSRHLGGSANRVVFGEGDAAARLMFIGEGPGAEEDATGRPFVGRSGQLLDKMIVAMGLTRPQVYIANITKLRCAEPDPINPKRLKDRPPTSEEAALGLPWLHQQIAIVQPVIIVTLGAAALCFLRGEKLPVTQVRGQWLDYRGVPLMPTFHPSYVLRNYTTETRAKVWSDLKLVMQKLAEA
ncbi:MAG: uracil-DNA glycosylase [Phycisphaerales bacterium]|nr:uracil-DNA glycosylase [Phycisphaerales bacterium]